jgi:CRP-like cAMP-binding protein
MMLGKWYRDGDMICRQGELSGTLFVIQHGKVEATHRSAEHEFCFDVLETEDFFGESALLDGETLAATYRAVGEACVLQLDRKMFLRQMNEDPSFAITVIRKLCRRVRSLEKALVRTVAVVPVDISVIAPDKMPGA